MNEKLLKKHRELFTGIIIAVFAIFYLIGSCSIKHIKHVMIGAEFMPRLYGSVLLLLACLQISEGIIMAKRFVDSSEEEKEEEQKSTKNAVITFALIGAYVAVMEILGFVVSSILFLFIMSIVLAPKNTQQSYISKIIFSIILPFSAFMLFRNVMHLSLPVGMIFGK